MARTQDDFEKFLRSDEFAGRLIRWVSIFESRLDSVLSAHFTPFKYDLGFDEIVLSRLSFAEKIDILRKIELSRPLKSRDNIVYSLDRLRKLRNALAHNHYLSTQQIKKLRSDKWIQDFVTGFPGSFGREKNALENRFSLLWKHFARKHGLPKDA